MNINNLYAITKSREGSIYLLLKKIYKIRNNYYINIKRWEVKLMSKKKYLTYCMFILVLMCIPTFANAKEVMHYYISLEPRTYVEMRYVTTTENYKYVLNNVNSTVGEPKVHSYYQTLYNGTIVTVGKKLSVKGAGNAYDSLWKSKNSTSNPSGYSINAKDVCVIGSNTNADWCAIENSSYRLKVANENLLYSISIDGAFTLTN